MSSPIGNSLGSLSTAGTIATGSGLVTYVQAIGGTVSLYSGSTSGKLLITATSSSYIPLTSPVQYGSSGLHMTISAGTAVVHTG